MKSRVLFADLRTTVSRSLHDKIHDLLTRSGIQSVVKPHDLTAVKVHFGEKGNTAYIRPIFLRTIIEKLYSCGARSFLTDANTLYRGERGDAVAHIQTALIHGFNYTTVNAPVIIADGLRGADSIKVPINGKHFSEAFIGAAIVQADSLVCVSHFKGHELSGFGGALKNLGMGCASRDGKMRQHTDINPCIEKKPCIGCGRCLRICPTQAIKIVKKKAALDSDLCIGCASCITVCPTDAVKINWDTDIRVFQEKMVEYALAAVKGKKNKILYLNFLTSISPQCDCYGNADQPIVADIGILASRDPVAIDQASADLVNAQCGIAESCLKKNLAPKKDKFRGLYPEVAWEVQLDYAEKLRIGTRKYALLKV